MVKHPTKYRDLFFSAVGLLQAYRDPDHDTNPEQTDASADSLIKLAETIDEDPAAYPPADKELE